MRIGIVGVGVVGSACRAGMTRCGYDVTVHDTGLEGTRLSDLLDREVIYVCVPTPSTESGVCDTSIVRSVVSDLYAMDYQGITAIKSTVSPGTTQELISEHDDRIVFVPEFLKERSAEYDFIFGQRLLLVGTDNINWYHLIVRSHGDLPMQVMRVRPAEAELMKYYHNTFNALRVVFANVYYEICRLHGADYGVVKEAFLRNGNMPDEYLDVSDHLRGYGGVCLPKDVRAMRELCREAGLGFELFDMIDRENSRFRSTVHEGMRP
jgi:UDPglucose 6-dehydrogenase